jgi:hypothetical protein
MKIRTTNLAPIKTTNLDLLNISKKTTNILSPIKIKKTILVNKNGDILIKPLNDPTPMLITKSQKMKKIMKNKEYPISRQSL